MANVPIVPVILAGGSGTRLWPLSRALFPKQFLPLTGERTMLQETLNRLEGIAGIGSPLVVCHDDHRFIVAEQLRQRHSADATIILEPVSRNTAPAIAVSALQALKSGGDPLLLVLAADHVIRDIDLFREAVAAAAQVAEIGAMATFGIRPVTPETGYGYLRAVPGEQGQVMRLATFVEKPDLETAQAYLASGEYFWNSGMFLFRASVYLEELGKFAPDMLEACRASLDAAKDDLDFVRLDKEAFAESPEDSVDYAVMEKTDKAMIVSLDAGWSDVGSWSVLWDVAEKDDEGNVTKGDVIGFGNENCFLQSSGGRLVAAVGLDNLIVVDTDDAVLIASKKDVQNVKKIVEKLKADKRSEAVQHRLVYRPWGSYDSIDRGARYQVKRITVNPGAKLSVQMHHHRAEHWVVVSGTARVQNGEQETLLTENESVYIPVGNVHALENPGKIPLELIEVQSGAYLGEDDIVRFEDRYGRHERK
ncbi:MAG: Mannose-1-phosphate guanylyltransferase (EC / Mannose-6-phosphate isomerase (EC [uncultured Paraburkholderia sp.]|nr:MAG: Mannose-1-phosphate guanylyltransferase (EC / Mannose-6-phosphate isomerase (EC [uncultured Paraburkholderia sp.]CAH2805196.1 MAG: Mannose-1-phosphate guanylyltransferase (EC / Mannose-6-phosphate isomerase (EC [uncultured Paraburkholderia sp.]CAH2942049.1 MAG: Mannose-1-phosphate guanylyltransferase (EC / Mannose-6-phosphate isomerase (EC [uncultured Paraburkholderia sp.]